MVSQKRLTRVVLLSVLILAVTFGMLTGCAQSTTTGNTPQSTEKTAMTAKTDLDGFPPQIPHALEGKEQCIVCHREGATGTAPKTPHPELTNCRQCHVLSE